MRRKPDGWKKHLWIPDGQVKKSTPEMPVPDDHWSALGEYIVTKQPDVIVCAGDFADMPSLSVYEPKGSKKFEGRRYADDIEAVQSAMAKLLGPLRQHQAWAEHHKKRVYTPRMVMLLGNHEDRITRAINADPAHLEGIISLKDLRYEEWGWEVHPFLETVEIDGIVYSHYFTSGIMGRAITNAKALLTKLHMSCVAGHQQGRDIAYGKTAMGKPVTALIAGSFYQHDEDYLTPQTNAHWRGVYVFHEVRDGHFDEMPVSMRYLLHNYGPNGAKLRRRKHEHTDQERVETDSNRNLRPQDPEGEAGQGDAVVLPGGRWLPNWFRKDSTSTKGES